VFVWFGAAQEANFVQMKSALSGIRVGQVMIREFRTLAPEDTLSNAVDHLLAGYLQDFPVMREGDLVGLLTRSALVGGLARLGRNMPVADAMEKDLPTAQPGETAEAAFQRLQSNGDRSMLVLEQGQLAGILTRENLGEYLMVQAALPTGPGGKMP
jgi:predicted transcriptional regulator